MPTEQPEGNIRDLKDFKDIQRACCKAIPLSLVAHKGPADLIKNLKNKLKNQNYIKFQGFLGTPLSEPLIVSLLSL